MTSVLSQLVRLREGLNGTPIFCMHYGNFIGLSAALDVDQSIYGIRTLGLGNAGNELTIEDLAHEHLAHLRSVQTHGPYRLLGYSFGGLVAYEMARCLTDAGENVGLLALFDAPSPTFRADLSPADLARVDMKYRADRRLKYWHNFKTCRFDRLAFDLWRLAGRAVHPVGERARKTTGLLAHPSATKTSDEARIKALWHAYKPKTLAARLVLFRAQGRDAEFGDDDSMGWRRFVTRGVEVRFAQGRHEDMMQPPNAGHLATLVNPYLHAAGQEDPDAPGSLEH